MSDAEITWGYEGEGLVLRWKNPFNGGRVETLAMMMWPIHAPEVTAEVEQMYEYIAADICAALAKAPQAAPLDDPNVKVFPASIFIAAYTASEHASVLSRGLLFRSIHDSREDAEKMRRDPQAIGFTVVEYAKAVPTAATEGAWVNANKSMAPIPAPEAKGEQQ